MSSKAILARAFKGCDCSWSRPGAHWADCAVWKNPEHGSLSADECNCPPCWTAQVARGERRQSGSALRKIKEASK